MLSYFTDQDTKDQRLKELAGHHSGSRKQTQDSTRHPRGSVPSWWGAGEEAGTVG